MSVSLPWIHLQMVITGNCVDFNLFFRWGLYGEIFINVKSTELTGLVIVNLQT